MESSSVSLNALSGTWQQFAQSALRVSRSAQDPTIDLASERVEQLNLKRTVQAQIEVLRTQDDMLGMLFDLKA